MYPVTVICLDIYYYSASIGASKYTIYCISKHITATGDTKGPSPPFLCIYVYFYMLISDSQVGISLIDHSHLGGVAQVLMV